MPYATLGCAILKNASGKLLPRHQIEEGEEAEAGGQRVGSRERRAERRKERVGRIRERGGLREEGGGRREDRDERKEEREGREEGREEGEGGAYLPTGQLPPSLAGWLRTYLATPCLLQPPPGDPTSSVAASLRPSTARCLPIGAGSSGVASPSTPTPTPPKDQQRASKVVLQ